MTAGTSKQATELFEQAIETYTAALKAGVKVQEEATEWIQNAMSDVQDPKELQQRLQKAVEQVLPEAQKNIEQSVQIMSDNARSSLELMKQALAISECDSISDAQGKTRHIWEQTLGTMRANTQSLVAANTRMIKTWGQMVQTETETVAS